MPKERALVLRQERRGSQILPRSRLKGPVLPRSSAQRSARFNSSGPWQPFYASLVLRKLTPRAPGEDDVPQRLLLQGLETPKDTESVWKKSEKDARMLSKVSALTNAAQSHEPLAGRHLLASTQTGSSDKVKAYETSCSTTSHKPLTPRTR